MLTTLPLALQLRQHARPLRLRGGRRTPLHSRYASVYSFDELPPGSKLEAGLVKVLHRSRILVVVANEGALVHSQWVRKEVEEFRRKHPKRQIISINVDRAIETFGSQVEAPKWLDHEDRTWLNETSEAIHEGIISPEVLTRFQLAPNFRKLILGLSV